MTDLPFEPIGIDHTRLDGDVEIHGDIVFRVPASLRNPEQLVYDHLIFGRYCQEQILPAINDSTWQMFRASIKGISTQEKLKALEEYIWDKAIPVEDSMYKKCLIPKVVAVRVTNYVNALKRGGQLK